MAIQIVGGTVSPSTALTINQQTGTTYTLASTDQNNVLIEFNNGSAITVNIPADATLNFPIGTQINLLQTGSGQVSVQSAAGAGVTVNGAPGLKLRVQWSAASLIKRASNLWVMVGDVTN